MNLEDYLKAKLERKKQEPSFQDRCYTCLRPQKTCYCHLLKAFDPQISFVILIHPIEYRRRLATGRMSHLCLKNSKLLLGTDFSQRQDLQKLIDDPTSESYVLFPGKGSSNLTAMTSEEKKSLTPSGKKIQIFVIDGTWSTAKTMLRLSSNLAALPRICFVPPRPSHFRVRKQPKGDFFSTIEAIHHTVELLGPSYGFDLAPKAHDNLLFVFDSMVDQHIEMNSKARAVGRTARFRVRGRSPILSRNGEPQAAAKSDR